MLQDGLDFEQVLAELARGNVVSDGNLQDVVNFLIQKSAQALAVARVNVWLFDAEREKIQCIGEYESATRTYQNCNELAVADFPSYFAALEELRTVAAMDAERDSRTQELRETYLRPRGITTMVDAPIFLQGKVVGVVCHEHTGKLRRWTQAEKSFAGSIADFISVSLEASRRLDLEQKLLEKKRLLFAITEQMTDGFCLLEPAPEINDFLVAYVNPSGAEMYGYEISELIGQPASIIRVHDSVNLFKKMAEAEGRGGSIVFETPTRRKDGTILPLEISLNVVHHDGHDCIALIGRDISERKEDEERRHVQQAKSLQSQRLESLGLLAGKVAHDFNNLLVGILGNLSLAMRELPPDNDKLRRNLANIESTANIAADLCNQLLIYSGRQKPDLSGVNLSEIVEEMIRLLEISLPPRVHLHSHTADDLPEIPAEPTQIRQVILNLVTNAADAVPPDHKGEIDVRTGTIQFTADRLQREHFDVQAPDFHAAALDKPSVCLEVRDNGAGMDETTRKQIFEPFFTTKDKGRGLGLATLGGIVRNHRGAIKVDSSPEKGTTFLVVFPTAE